MGLFDKFLKKKAAKAEECVLIHLDGVNLSHEVYETHDLVTLEDLLIDAINRNRVGELDGNEVGEKVTTIFTYGPDAGRLYQVMEPILTTYPLCQNARVIIRKGGPGTPQTEVQL